MLGGLRKLPDKISPRGLNLISRISFMVAAAGVLALMFSDFQLISGIASIASAGLLLWTREISHLRNQSLRAQVAALEGRPLPQQSTAAAILGQSDLATMNYSGLVDRLRRDGHIK